MFVNEQLNQFDAQTQNVQQRGLWIPLLCIWLLMLLTFSAPGREGPSEMGALDAIALVKLAVRVIGLVLLGLAIFSSWRQPRRQAVARCLLPLGLYVCWSILSTLWSPLKSISLGQAGGLLVQVMLAFTVALRCTDPCHRSKVLYHLSLAMLAFSTVVLIINALSHEASGLGRGLSIETQGGFVHPTAAGATASLGIVILVAARLLWDWRWSKVLLMPGLLIHIGLLVLAASRTAMAMGVVTVVLSFLLFSRRFILSAVTTMVCIAAVGYLAADPGLELADKAFGSVVEYAQRGETIESMQTLTGRTILWEAIWDSFTESPLIGHGYFVTSKSGALDVWGGPSNHSAHNVVLQVLVSTGLIGVILFLWGLIQPFAICKKSLMRNSGSRKLAALLGLLGIWYFGWGLLCAAFMGPVRPESVTFFTLLGLALGSLPSIENPPLP